jgi:hypothetical protein
MIGITAKTTTKQQGYLQKKKIYTSGVRKQKKAAGNCRMRKLRHYVFRDRNMTHQTSFRKHWKEISHNMKSGIITEFAWRD